MPLELNADKFLKAKQQVPNLLRKSLKFGLQEIGDRFQFLMNRDQFSGKLTGKWRRNRSKKKLANRSGALRRSQNFTVRGLSTDSLTLRATIGDALTAPYARLQEKGGTIVPKRAKALTIPMPDNLTPSGQARFPRAKGMQGVFLLKTKKGAFLVRKSAGFDPFGGSGQKQLEFLWMLKKKVTIPPRLRFVATWESTSFERWRTAKLNARVAKALEKAGLS